MILVDKALQERQSTGNPIRVGMVGAGFMGRGIALQILTATPGMELVAISNRHLQAAIQAYNDAGVEEPIVVGTTDQLEKTISQGQYAITEDALLLSMAEGIDALIEVTGTVEFASQVVLAAINNHKHVILVNAELDSTLGPILKVYADKAGVVLTNTDGDEPGVQMNLYRFVRGLGFNPVLCGNIKSLYDPYRNPTTQEGFARMVGQKPHMVTSFADGSKMSFEQSIVANATGMRVAKRGMVGPTVPAGTSIVEAIESFPVDLLDKEPGIVDYIIGAEPAAGVFVLGTYDHPIQRYYLNVHKMGEGPFYCFYRPYHLCHFEVPITVARAVLFNDAVISPLDAPCVDVVATAKIDLQAGQILDGIGHYMTYGLCENASNVLNQGLLPLGLAEGCQLRRDIRKDQVLTYADVAQPEGRLADKLRSEQSEHFQAVLRY